MISQKKAPIRIELMHNGFADHSLTAWVRRQNNCRIHNKKGNVQRKKPDPHEFDIRQLPASIDNAYAKAEKAAKCT